MNQQEYASEIDIGCGEMFCDTGATDAVSTSTAHKQTHKIKEHKQVQKFDSTVFGLKPPMIPCGTPLLLPPSSWRTLAKSDKPQMGVVICRRTWPGFSTDSAFEMTTI